MKLSVVVPLYNEEQNVSDTLNGIISTLSSNNIPYEIIAVNDASSDSTGEILSEYERTYPTIKVVHRKPPNGFGLAVRDGIKNITGDVVVITMGDGSDDPADIIKYYEKIKEGYDCVFGSRFLKHSMVIGYPKLKFIINRVGNFLVSILFSVNHNDLTNAFKCYRRVVIERIQPIISTDFEVTLEMALKAILCRKFSFATIPINWFGRKHGKTKMKLFIIALNYLRVAFTIKLDFLLKGFKK